MISALEHFVYCPRQWSLIHVEQFFSDNDDTVRGHHIHEQVDTPGSVTRNGVRTERRLPVWSTRLGLYGFCDVVEVRPAVGEAASIIPVEYKSGARFERAAEVQLAAQAMCLEEMLDTSVPAGVIYLAGTSTRHPISIDAELRAKVEETVAALRQVEAEQRPLRPVNDRRCNRCSLREACQPNLVSLPEAVRRHDHHTWAL